MHLEREEESLMVFRTTITDFFFNDSEVVLFLGCHICDCHQKVVFSGEFCQLHQELDCLLAFRKVYPRDVRLFDNWRIRRVVDLVETLTVEIDDQWPIVELLFKVSRGYTLCVARIITTVLLWDTDREFGEKGVFLKLVTLYAQQIFFKAVESCKFPYRLVV